MIPLWRRVTDMAVRWKLAGLVALLLGTSLLLLGLFLKGRQVADTRYEQALSWAHHATVIQELDRLAARYVSCLAHSSEGEATPEACEAMEGELEAVARQSLELSRGFSAEEQREEEELAEALEQIRSLGHVQQAEPSEERAQELQRLYVEQVSGLIRARVEEEREGSERWSREARESSRWVQIQGGVLMGGGLIVGVLLSLLLARHLTRSVSRLHTGALKFSAGELDHRVEVSSGDELGQLAVTLNQMATRLEQTMVSKAELEARVSERTRELESSRRELAESLEELKLTRSQLLLSERLATVGTLAAGVAHEINNPLAYLMSNLNFVRESLRSTLPLDGPGVSKEEARERGEILSAIEESLHGAGRVRDIIRDLKAFSRLDGELRNLIDVHLVLESTLRIMGSELPRGVQLVKEYGALPRVKAHEGRLGQVFLNLLLNAVQALPPEDSRGNVIRLVTSTDEQGRACVEVHDNGMGIPPEVMERIFDPFFTTKPVGSGAGLGLSVCHSIVTSLGGEIRVDSRPGQGTVFRVLLPAAR